MKKMTAGLLGLVLSVLCVLPSVAQNLPRRYDAAGIGAVNYSLNSGGSFYGQEFNSGTASNWSLGFGSSQSTVGTGVLTWDSAGHTGLKGIGAPAVSSCGTNASAATGSDAAGDVSVGTSATACTLTFAAAYAAVPHCFCSNRSTRSACVAQATTSAVILYGTGASIAASDTLDYVCIGN